MVNQVFLSYRHESPEHARAVKRLGELLRQAKLPVMLDQFYLDDHPGGPNEGWPKWCEDCANESACVVVIGSPGWFDAYEGKGASGTGCGAAVEAQLFRQFLYDEQGINPRLRLALLKPLPEGCAVPERLRTWHQFRPFDSDTQLDQLVAWIAQRLGLDAVQSPTVRWPEPDDEFTPDLADRIKREWPAIKDLLAGRSRERILLFEGGTGLGKSVLIRQAEAYAKTRGVVTCRVDLKAKTDVASILGQLDLDLAEHLPSFSREGASKTHLLRKDLRALRTPVLLIFDSYDQPAVENEKVANWLSLELLNEVETSLALTVIVGGQKAPGYTSAGWRTLARHLPLEPITEPEHWQPWVERKYPGFQAKGAHVPTVVMLAGGNPAVVSASCEAIARR